jgi:hypothetical protein
MKKSTLGIIVYSLIALPSCAPYVGTSPPTDKREDMRALPNNFLLLDLGRTISKGTVDIFDPWLTAFSLPKMDTPENPLTFPEHPTMLIRDDRVIVYTLRDSDSPPYNDFFDILNGETLELPPAVPLIEEEPL